MRKINVMLDLETLGTAAGCKVLSIGAVVFGQSGLGAEFYVEVFRTEQGRLKEDANTVAWWDKQAPIVRDRLFSDHDGKYKLKDGLKAFDAWLPVGDRLVWGNGADFDNPILGAAYTAMKLPIPWSPYNGRCYRTLKSLAPSTKLQRTGSLHNALDDAKSQAGHAVQILDALALWPQVS